MNRIQNENAEFLIKVLDQNQCIWIEDIVHDFYMNGKDCTRGLKFSVKRLVLQSKEKFNNDNFKVWFPVIVEAMNDFLSVDNLSAPPSYRQVVYENFLEWCNEIADIYWDHVKAKEIINELIRPVHDMTVDLVKMLHGDGVSKRKICYDFNVDPRTVTNNLKRLDIKNKGKLAPLRIGGQPVYLKIKAERREQDDDDERDELGDIAYTSRYKERNYYYTPDTMHPFVMQYNVTQAAILIKSLYLYNSKTESDICYNMAIDVWCQLSDYGRERIKKIFGREDSGFNDFLKEMNSYLDGSNMLVFTPEGTFLEKDSDLKANEQLLIAFKSSKVCRIIFLSKYKMDTLYGQRIMQDEKGYYAVPKEAVVGSECSVKYEKNYLDPKKIYQLIAD